MGRTEAGLCRFSGAFGRPGEGAHRWRVGGLAAVDLAATAGAALLGARLVAGRGGLAAAALALAVLLLAAGVLAHEAFCVNTRLGAALFGRPWPGPHPRAAARPGAGAAQFEGGG
jgi:hypothetical protein